jgi:hypothetical protein
MDFLPKRAGCIRTMIVVLVSMVVFIYGIMLACSGLPQDYEYDLSEPKDGGVLVKTFHQTKDTEFLKVIVGVVLMVVCFPMMAVCLSYYLKKCMK